MSQDARQDSPLSRLDSVALRNDVPLGRRSPMAKTRVVVADRNVITRVGIRSILERNSGVAVVAEATSSTWLDVYASRMDSAVR